MVVNRSSFPLMCMVSFVLGCPSNPPEEDGAPFDEVLQAGLDRLHAGGIVGVHAEVVDGGRRTRARSGVGQMGSDRPVDFDSYFRMGSNTKTFVSVVVLQLAAEGALSLEDSVDAWLPGVVSGNGNDGKQITIRQLLQHTSGLYNYTGEVDEGEEDPQPDLPVLRSEEQYLELRLEHAEPEELVALAMQHAPRFAPGAAWSYSNTNYVLAGMIIERVTGNPWSVEVESRILDPLGLERTFEPGDAADLPEPHARAYQQFEVGGPLVDVTIANHSWGGAAGSLVTTTSDLVRFWQAIHDGSLLDPEEIAELHDAVPAPPLEAVVPGARYGLGIMYTPTSCGGGYWSHAGDAMGYSTRNATNEDGSRAVVISLSTQFMDSETAFETIKDSLDLIDQIMCAD